LMVAGELVTQGTPSGLKAEQQGRVIELLTDAPQKADRLLKSQLERWRVSLFGDRLHVIVDEDASTAIRDLTERLKSESVHVQRAVEQPYSLEDVFIAVVEKLRKEGKSGVE
jgi:ABC-2 type transport system ATP-binding protein